MIKRPKLLDDEFIKGIEYAFFGHGLQAAQLYLKDSAVAAFYTPEEILVYLRKTKIPIMAWGLIAYHWRPGSYWRESLMIDSP
jgi:hypothetical protein